MLELWLMRHGEAVDPDEAPRDELRPLTPRGTAQVEGLGRWLRERVAPLDAVWHSPLTRARQTATLMAREFGVLDRLTETPLMAPGMAAERLLAELAARPLERVLCVGHQPDIGQAVSALLGGGRCEIPPGFCAALRFPSRLQMGSGQLLWVTDPNWFGA